jgi:hypothetical protein
MTNFLSFSTPEPNMSPKTVGQKLITPFLLPKNSIPTAMMSATGSSVRILPEKNQQPKDRINR